MQINELPPNLEQLVADGMAAWGIPGLALAICNSEEITYARGFGVRSVDDPQPVDADTVFAIGSATKAYTAFALAALVGEGKVGWDDPVVDYLPDFQFHDPWVARQVTIRDLLCHRTGLPRGIRILLSGEMSLREYVRRVRQTPLATGFRHTFGYTNTTIEAAGFVVEAVTGRSWGDYLRQTIADPTGMDATSFSVGELTARAPANLTRPHAHVGGDLRVVQRLDIGEDASGSINASARDVARWVQLNLRRGRWGEQQIAATAAVQETHNPQIILHHPERTVMGLLTPLDPPIRFYTYGLGWFVNDYHGAKTVWHGGQINGYAAMVGFLPDHDFGYVILTNIHETIFHAALMFMLQDAALGAPPRDWSGEFLQLAAEMGRQQGEARAAAEANRAADSTPSREPTAYAGSYTSPRAGTIHITLEDGGLVARYGTRLVGELTHWQYDQFLISWRDPLTAPELVAFQLDGGGVPATLQIDELGTFIREE